jgi:hypothetical protein
MNDLSAKFSALETALAGRLDSVIEKLDQLHTDITTGGNLDSAPIVAAIEAMRGTGTSNTLANIDAALRYSSGGTNWTTAGLLNAIALDLVDGGIGNATWLTRILAAIKQLGIEPDGDTSEAIQSIGTSTTNGNRYVVWGAINGLTRDETHTALTPTASWAGYEVYFKTNAPYITLHDITTNETSQVSANSWIFLSGNHTYAWSVDSSYDIIGYMRGIPAPGYTLTTTYFSDYWWLVQSWPIEIPTINATAASGDFYGWSARHISGISVRFKAPGSDDTYATLSSGQTITLPHTDGISIGSRLGDEGAGEAVLELIPPA